MKRWRELICSLWEFLHPQYEFHEMHNSERSSTEMFPLNWIFSRTLVSRRWEKELLEIVNIMRKASEPSQLPFEPEELDSENAKRILLEVIEELRLGKE